MKSDVFVYDLFDTCIRYLLQAPMITCEKMFNDRRVITFWLFMWTMLTCVVFFWIMYVDNSPFLQFGPNSHTKLFGVVLNSWAKWWCVAIYTFVSTCIAAFAGDSIVPFITNTIQDHKTLYIPYSKFTCLAIIQVFTCYSVVISIVGLFVALTQIDFTFVRLLSDLIVNHITTAYFLRGKVVNLEKYNTWMEEQTPKNESDDVIDENDGSVEMKEEKALIAKTPKSDKV
tara:strand:+ start:9364 stop:10050 length:687 start_codon:yes stop_codon:yes gene_type:complete